jgi:hypothetical protein
LFFLCTTVKLEYFCLISEQLVVQAGCSKMYHFNYRYIGLIRSP